VFVRIAERVGSAQFAFICHSSREITDAFRARLVAAFKARGMDTARHCVFLPRMSPDRFAAAVGACDIVLDSIGWSGGNTTLEGLGHALPIVTISGPFMRGRHTRAILTMMGVTGTIAATVDEYVALAVRLALDRGWRDAVAPQMAENEYRVYRDQTCIHGLETFLDRVARESPTARADPRANDPIVGAEIR
jgi:predicted O-linked N-acetylglucosamine transferase (SPINDLY family)